MFAFRQIKMLNNEAIDDAGGASWSDSHSVFNFNFFCLESSFLSILRFKKTFIEFYSSFNVAVERTEKARSNLLL